MSTIGSPIQTSLVQAAQAQQVAGKAKDAERARSETANRFQDRLELRAAGVDSTDAVRKLPQNQSEEAESEHRGEDHSTRPSKDDDEARIDLTA